MTLVELLIALAVTTIVLSGLAGVLYNVTGRYQGWADRVSGASTGMAIAAALQADSHRYVVCHPADRVPELDFCLPDTGTLVVTYVVSGSGPPYSIVRTQLPNGAGVLVASQLPHQPLFWSQCIPGSGTISGHIHIYNFRPDP
ncbi:MAG TPA: hypothetical protein VKF59_06600, partial [Candidatus Dormibacteraeota bacterium]|nr:hypothetical protein [Candidatus Dormibacteraeota bacterium]